MKRKTFLFLLFILISLTSAACNKKAENTKEKTKVVTTKKNTDTIPKTTIETANKKVIDDLKLLIFLTASIRPATPCENRQIFDLTDSNVKEALNAYSSVLSNQSEFISAFTHDSEFLSQRMEYFSDSFKISMFALIDLDNNKVPEVILPYTHLNTNNSNEFYCILYYKEGHVYSFERSNRQFDNVKIDGTFEFSGGSGYGGYATFSFVEDIKEKTPFTYNRFTYQAFYEQNPETGEWIDYEFIVNNQNVTKDVYDSASDAQNHKQDVTWHAFTDTEIKQYFSVY